MDFDLLFLKMFIFYCVYHTLVLRTKTFPSKRSTNGIIIEFN